MSLKEQIFEKMSNAKCKFEELNKSNSLFFIDSPEEKPLNFETIVYVEGVKTCLTCGPKEGATTVSVKYLSGEYSFCEIFDEKYMYVYKEDDWFVFLPVLKTKKYTISPPDDDLKNFGKEITENTSYKFNVNMETFIYNKSTNKCHVCPMPKNSRVELKIITLAKHFELSCCHLKNLDDIYTITDKDNDVLSVLENKKIHDFIISLINLKKDTKKKPCMNDCLKTEGIDISSIMKEITEKRQTGIKFISNNVKGKRESEFRCACGHCFLQAETTYSYSFSVNNVGCPKCGKEKFFNISYLKPASISGYTVAIAPCKNTNNVAIMLFSYTEKYIEKAIYNGKEAELIRLFILSGEKIYNKSDDRKVISMINPDIITSDEEIIKIINNSNAKYLGILDAWGLNPEHPERKIENCLSIFRSGYNETYLVNVYKHPVYEKLLKAFDGKRVDSILTNIKYCAELYDFEKNTVQEVLGVSKMVLKYAATNPEVQLCELQKIEQHIKLDPKASIEEILEIMKYEYQTNKSYEDLVDKVPSLRIFRILKYISNAHYEQCIHKDTCFQIYCDYINLASLLKYDLKNKEILFPSSLEKEHDKAIVAVKGIKDKINREKFSNNFQQKYNWLLYEDNKYKIILPKSPEEVVAEGKNQNHCVATYIDKMADEKCIICFMRKKDNINSALYTIEIEPKSRKLIQIRGNHNSSPSGIDDLAFISRWKEHSKIN